MSKGSISFETANSSKKDSVAVTFAKAPKVRNADVLNGKS